MSRIIGALKALFTGKPEPAKQWDPQLIVLHPKVILHSQRKKRAVLPEREIYKLGPDTFTVGRGKGPDGADLKLHENAETAAIASPVHFQFRRDRQGRCWVKNYSLEGMKVNGFLLDDVALKHGDIVSSATEEASPPKVAIVFDQNGKLSEKLGDVEELMLYLATKLVKQGKLEK